MPLMQVIFPAGRDGQGEAVPFNGTGPSFSSLENRFDDLNGQLIG